jgi:hypothetical protein
MKIDKGYFYPETERIESREKGPTLEIKFLFSPHGTAEDFKNFESEFNNADVFVPEVFGWDEETLQSLREFSEESDSEFKAPNLGLATGEIVRNILGSQKAIELVDVPKGDPIEKLQKESIKIGNESLNLDDFDEMVSGVKSFLIKFSESQKLREKYIISKIKTLKNKIIEDYPELVRKDKLNVLVSLGSFHVGVYGQIKESFETAQELNTVPKIYDNLVEILQKLQQIEYPENDHIADIEVARWWISAEIREGIFSPTANTEKFSEYLWLASKQFSLEEIRSLFGRKNPKMPHIKEELEKKGFPVPMSGVMLGNHFDKLLEECRKFGA